MVSITFHLYQKLHLNKKFPFNCMQTNKQIHPFMQINPSLKVQTSNSILKLGFRMHINSLSPGMFRITEWGYCFAECTMGCDWSRSNRNQLLRDYLLASGSIVMTSRHGRLAAITCNVKSVQMCIHLGFECASKYFTEHIGK